MFVRCFVCVFECGTGYSLIGGDVMMIGVSIVVILFAILLTAATAIAFVKRRVICVTYYVFLAMLAVGVVIVLVFIYGI